MTDSDKSAPADISIPSATRLEAFAREDLITCEECLRANAPNRASCMYCGAALTVKETLAPPSPAAAMTESPIETSRHTVILLPDETQPGSDAALERAAALARRDAKELKSLRATGGWLPLMTGPSAEANEISDELRTLGLQTTTIPEDSLTRATVRRIRGLTLTAESITAFPPTIDDSTSSWDDLFLIVIGRLVTHSTEVKGKARRDRKSERDDQTQLSTDEAVMDLYFKSRSIGWRIFAHTFDFSCLGANKRITAFENFSMLVDSIREHAPNISVDGAYQKKRPWVSSVWPTETRSSTSGLRRRGGRIGLAKVTTVDNEAQFDKYSQLSYQITFRNHPSGR